MMSLEDVKERKWYVTTKGLRHSYARVVHTQECSYVPRATNAHVWTRNPLDEKDTSGLYPCQRCKPTASPKTIAKQKAKLATDLAAEREREQAREERWERLESLADFLEGVLDSEAGFIVQPQDGYVELWRNGFKYRIEEVSAHREE